jgi:hypothetical protein
VLIAREKSPSSTNNFFSFLGPFNVYLWLAVVAVIFTNGFGLYIFGERSQKYLQYVYMSYGQFTEVEFIEGENIAEKILNMGFSFLVLLTIAAYTASYSSLVYNQNVADQPISSLQDIIDIQASVCQRANSDVAAITAARYPSLSTVSLTGTGFVGLFNEIGNGRKSSCRAGLVPQDVWDRQSISKASNRDCTLYQVNRAIVLLVTLAYHQSSYCCH